MSTENENRQEGSVNEENQNVSRDGGYKSYNRDNNYNRYNNDGEQRQYRPRTCLLYTSMLSSDFMQPLRWSWWVICGE